MSANASPPASQRRPAVRRDSWPAPGSSWRHTSSVRYRTAGNVAMPCYIEQVPPLLVLLILASLCVLLAVNSAYGPVARHRVALFARRQRLIITVANGEQVIRYLATTRRWRAAGIGGGLVISFWRSFPNGGL